MSRETYEAEYTCVNCRTKEVFHIEFGMDMPDFVYPLPEDAVLSQFFKEAPECKYCGCRDWSSGKKPSYM